jgi:pimeloyl-ACP methyl ester carboxylesterase
MNELVERWRARGRFVEHGGMRLFRVVEGDGPNLVCFHGFPSNAFDWHRLLPLLTLHRRVIVFDFPGSGLSDKPRDYSYSLIDQMNVTEQLLLSEGFQAFDLICHDMGDTVGSELFYRLEHHETRLQVRRAIFLNGSVYMALHHPLPTQRLLRVRIVGPLLGRLSTKPLFVRQFGKLLARRDALSDEEFDAYWTLLRANGGRQVIAKVAQYMNERLRNEARWVEPLRRLSIPLLILWGQDDPVSLTAIAERLHQEVPHSTLTYLPGVGHYPHLEDPQRVAATLEAFLSAV